MISRGLREEKAIGLEKDRLFKVINEKYENIKNLQVMASSLEQDLTSAFILFFSEVVENLVTVEKLIEDLEKAKHMIELEIKEKNKRIIDLEKEVSGLRNSMTSLEEAMFTENLQADELLVFKHYWKPTNWKIINLKPFKQTKISHHE
ncbi:hypothetical protein D8674_031033 [Pyrus ussuriensis x Pyrus communis]|uniref:Uncharacterized protein n=1 Tax=Pyrus ussuriensis x Pyrus communis TaxID=2448454 RepID=A0A5N5EYL4_9ROSA|nr:hypothetical protein D8674_031033 [Pyrus ussuriensis x Pyrus communis]